MRFQYIFIVWGLLLVIANVAIIASQKSMPIPSIIGMISGIALVIIPTINLLWGKKLGKK